MPTGSRRASPLAALAGWPPRWSRVEGVEGAAAGAARGTDVRAAVAVISCALAVVASCTEPAPTDPPSAEVAPTTAPPAREEAGRLDVPPGLLQRARDEAAGLDRLPASLRQRALERGRERGSPTYESLRRDTAAHEHQRVSYEGHVSFVGPAGAGLSIMALSTRREGERWVDPLYVLSVVPPGVPASGDASARIDGWLVGERTIGRHALPLVVAFHVERLEGAP